NKENAQFCAFSTLQTPKGARKSEIFAVKGRKNPQVPQAPSSLSRFAHKTSKNRLQGDFLPRKLRKQPNNRGFHGFFQRKNHENLQVQQAARISP
ncbi:MAG: hypothetical protein LBF95_03595, partial [Treponema sp.]|nr:hypothetical protein [Treponema sp.]